ncbi:hypothetical protein P0136_09220 [Lentisphaerota bacterium ZTH]|nr:hypothetical protein JYG24_13270 [Lentisphaerota bacterium]WET05543.1 hypothetical protein P0136_09220 [Lentisphaerota bacterium ZTH]
MLKFAGKKGDRLAVVFCGGQRHTAVAAGKIRTFDDEKALGASLKWSRENNCNQVVLVHNSDIYELKLANDNNNDIEDMNRAAALELAEIRGNGVEKCRAAMFFADSVGTYRHNVLAAGFSQVLLKEYNRQCKRQRLKYCGSVAFRQVLLNFHFDIPENQGSALLLLDDDNSFCAYIENRELKTRNIPVAVPVHFDEQWLNRFERRLAVLKGKKITFYASKSAEPAAEHLKKIITPESLSIVKIDEILVQLADVLGKKSAGKGRSSIPALPPPREKDPREAGTVVCLILIFGSLTVLLFQYMQLSIAFNSLNKSISSKTSIKKTLDSHQTQLEELKKKLKKVHDLCKHLDGSNRVDKNYLVVLNLLSRYPLKYSRITSVTQQNNGIIICGETHWQPDLSRFLSHFEQELSERSLSLASEGLTKSSTGMLTYKCRIRPLVKQ